MAVVPSPVDVWPFLITRGRTVGQRTVLAPGFLTSTGRHPELKTGVTHPQKAESGFLRQHLSLDPEGEFTLFFEKVTAHSRMLGGDTGYLLDEGSRRVEITQGVIVSGDHPDIDLGVMDSARKVIARTFEAFWKADDRHSGPVEAPKITASEEAYVDLSAIAGGSETTVAGEPPVAVTAPSEPGACDGPRPVSVNPARLSRRPSARYRSRAAWLVIGVILVCIFTAIILVGSA